MKEVKFRAWDKDKINVRKGSKGMYKQNGYILAKAEYHPHANKKGYVPLHRLLIENELGRYLTPRKELVHHIDGDRSNNDLQNLKLTTPQEHYIEEHFEKRNPNGRFVADEPIFGEIKYRLFDRDKNITQIYTLKELMSKTFRRAKFEFRGRFTGLKDRDGKEIYEGDIVTSGHLVTYSTGRGRWFSDVGVVVHDTRNGCLTIDNDDGRPKRLTVKVIKNNRVQVIGNIHDNPELMEEKK